MPVYLLAVHSHDSPPVLQSFDNRSRYRYCCKLVFEYRCRYFKGQNFSPGTGTLATAFREVQEFHAGGDDKQSEFSLPDLNMDSTKVSLCQYTTVVLIIL